MRGNPYKSQAVFFSLIYLEYLEYIFWTSFKIQACIELCSNTYLCISKKNLFFSAQDTDIGAWREVIRYPLPQPVCRSEPGW